MWLAEGNQRRTSRVGEAMAPDQKAVGRSAIEERETKAQCRSAMHNQQLLGLFAERKAVFRAEPLARLKRIVYQNTESLRVHPEQVCRV